MFRRAALASLAFVLGCPGAQDAPDAAVLADAPSTALDAATDDTGPSSDASALDAPSTDDAGARRGVVHVVLFTHIEDSTPAGDLSSPMARMGYVRLRTQLLAMAELMERHGLRWVLQPDYKYLEAALLYEDAATTMDTGGLNLFVYLRDVRGVVVDPHSHENGGYSYPDVAHLLERLGVGGSTVIGGHIWDPSLTQFQEWDRFRAPVAGMHYPEASWRGDILIGAGTPGHVNDPLASGVWRPRDRDHFFEDDPSGNIVALGAWENGVAGVRDLVARHADGTVPPDQLLTASWNLQPMMLTAPGGLDAIEADVLVPIEALRDEGSIVVTDFTTLVEIWRRDYGARPTLYMPSR